MKFGERLRQARDHAGLTQGELAELCHIRQPSVNYLETGDATGSAHTVQLALACGVRPKWLAMESGEMTDADEVKALKAAIGNKKIMKALLVMESLPEYALDNVNQSLTGTQKLLHDAESGKVPKKKAEGEN